MRGIRARAKKTTPGFETTSTCDVGVRLNYMKQVGPALLQVHNKNAGNSGSGLERLGPRDPPFGTLLFWVGFDARFRTLVARDAERIPTVGDFSNIATTSATRDPKTLHRRALWLGTPAHRVARASVARRFASRTTDKMDHASATTRGTIAPRPRASFASPTSRRTSPRVTSRRSSRTMVESAPRIAPRPARPAPRASPLARSPPLARPQRPRRRPRRVRRPRRRRRRPPAHARRRYRRHHRRHHLRGRARPSRGTTRPQTPSNPAWTRARRRCPSRIQPPRLFQSRASPRAPRTRRRRRRSPPDLHARARTRTPRRRGERRSVASARRVDPGGCVATSDANARRGPRSTPPSGR